MKKSYISFKSNEVGALLRAFAKQCMYKQSYLLANVETIILDTEAIINHYDQN